MQISVVLSFPHAVVAHKLSMTALRRDGPDLAQHLIFGFLIFWERKDLIVIGAVSIASGRCLERVLIPEALVSVDRSELSLLS